MKKKKYYHPGRGDYGDPCNRPAALERTRKASIDLCYQRAQEARDARHKAKTRAFYAEKRKKHKEISYATRRSSYVLDGYPAQ